MVQTQICQHIFIDQECFIVSQGHYDVKIVLMMEIFPARLRGNVIILDGLLWGVGITVLAGLGYAFDGLNWRDVQLMMLPPFIVIIAYFLYVIGVITICLGLQNKCMEDSLILVISYDKVISVKRFL